MLARPIRFSKPEDIDLLLATYGEQRESLDFLTKQFVIATNGNTYSLDGISWVSDEEIETSDLYFPTKSGTQYSVFEVRKAMLHGDTILLDELVHNKPLAKMLITGTPPSPSVLDVLPLVFPVISDAGNTYEQHAIEDFLEHCRKQRLKQRDPFTDLPLSKKQIFINRALEQLIHVQIRDLKNLKRELSEEYKINPTRKLKTRLNGINKILEQYKTSLLYKRMYYQDKKKYEIDVWQRDYHHFKGMMDETPELRDKGLPELKLLNPKYRISVQRWRAIEDIARRIQDQICFKVGFFATLAILSILSISGSELIFASDPNPVNWLLLKYAGYAAAALPVFLTPTPIVMLSQYRANKLSSIENIITNMISLLKEKVSVQDFMERYAARVLAIDEQLSLISSADDEDIIFQDLLGEKLDEGKKFALDEEPPFEQDNGDRDLEPDEEYGYGYLKSETQPLLPLNTTQRPSSWSLNIKQQVSTRWASLFYHSNNDSNNTAELNHARSARI